MSQDELFDPARNRHVAAFLRTMRDSSSRLDTRIHPADEMYRFERSQPRRSDETAALFYFHTGHTIFGTLRQVAEWRYGGVQRLGRVLDFASGFGRATRFLVREMDPAHLHVAEIDPTAVAFQESVFGVSGYVSHNDPNTLKIPRAFDVITAWSFFSHLPADRFETWLRRLFDLLSPGGTLIFSVHGMELLGAERDPSQEFFFRASSETKRLDVEAYGTSYATAEFVQRVAASATASEGLLLAYPYGLCGFQDVYVLLRKPFHSLPALRLPRSPWGMMDASSIEEGVATVRGWAMADPSERPPAVALYVDDQRLALSPGHGDKGEFRRWAFEFPIRGIDPDAIIRIEATSTRGLSKIMVAETLRPYLDA